MNHYYADGTKAEPQPSLNDTTLGEVATAAREDLLEHLAAKLMDEGVAGVLEYLQHDCPDATEWAHRWFGKANQHFRDAIGCIY